IRDFHVTGVQTCALPIFPFKKSLFASYNPGPECRIYKMRCNKDSMSVLFVVKKVQLFSTRNVRKEFQFNSREIRMSFNSFPFPRSEERRVGKECSSVWYE